jgi:hypothetical protein
MNRGHDNKDSSARRMTSRRQLMEKRHRTAKAARVRRASAATIVIVMGLVTSGAAAQDGRSPGALGDGTELIYENCYENVAGFRVPLTIIRGLVGSELPAGFAYRTFDDAASIGQLNVIALQCDQAGHEVADVIVNALVNAPDAFRAGRPTALRIRTYTSSTQTRARHGQFCFGNVTTLAGVEASVEIDLTTGVRPGHALATDGDGSVELTTTTSGAEPNPIGQATLQHFTVEDGEVHGRIEWGTLHGGRSQLVVQAALVLDGAQYTGIPGVTGQHVFAEDGAPHAFFHRGLTFCPPGPDWRAF